MATLFEETAINGMAMRNRMVRSATWEGMCDQNGRPTEKLIDCYCDLARGGIGLIVSGYTFVRPDGKGFPGKMGIHTDDFATDYEICSVLSTAPAARLRSSWSMPAARPILQTPVGNRLPLRP